PPLDQPEVARPSPALAGADSSGASRAVSASVRSNAHPAVRWAKKLLHLPQLVLKKGGADPVDGAALVAAVQRLFELEVAEPGAAPPSEAEAEPSSPGKVAGS
ncbi:MAG: hypothetical protein ABI560_17960, partial [Myxococcales bacterium]